MAEYCTREEVRRVVTRSWARQANTTGALPDDQIEDAIAAAQAEVDGKLGSRYEVPFDPVPTQVHTIALDIAAFLATLNYRQEKEIPDHDPAIRRKERACCLLKDIAAGMADLDAGVDDPGPTPRTRGGMGTPIERTGDGRLWALADFGLGTGLDDGGF